MRVVNASNVKWQGMRAHIRGGGGLMLKRLLAGREGAPENYLFNVAHSLGDYSTPRHRHNFDQIRFVLEGDMRISPNQVVKEGQVCYFPEGTAYGPYDDAGRERKIMIVQFGGASGSGYVSEGQQARARAEMLKSGAFRDGMYVREKGEGPKRQDAFRAVWEHCTGRRMDLPKPRYEKPVIVDPRNFDWRPAGRKGVARKTLGIFTERETRLEMVRIDAGARWTGAAERAVRLCFVMEGTGKAGSRRIGKWSGIEVAPGEKPDFATDSGMTLFCLVMPLIGEAATKKAA
jgi:mannose-6-phosphate isomerase-like protein (cupin superfamily)